MQEIKNLFLTSFSFFLMSSVLSQTDTLQDWHLKDFTTDFRGINVEKAYQELLLNKAPQEKVILAVIDSGVDIEHADLQELIWINKDEIDGNGIDDDGNGFVDDIHGWNFLGNANGDMVGKDNLEVAREYKVYHKRFGSITKASEIGKNELEDWKYYQRLKNDFEEGRMRSERQLKQFTEFQQSIEIVTERLKQKFGDDFTQEDIQKWEPENEMYESIKGFYMYLQENNVDDQYMKEYGDQVKTRAEWYYNTDVDTRRDIIKDDPNNPYEKGYGNNKVEGPDAFHGTHVAGIIGAMRNNSIGMNGIANHIEIMVLRAVPKGDEHDKDVANAIRYAVDNGARVVNMSFGKAYSPQEKIVAEAIQYAEDHDVLLVHAAGNESINLDNNEKYPDNFSEYIKGKVKTYITVGASAVNGDENFVASFSNYSPNKVDIFAPGVSIYSTVPDNEYDYSDGTSMAAPVVSGVAALMMSYFPDLSARDIKKIIEKSAKDLSYHKVYLPGSGEKVNGVEQPKQEVAFEELSRTAGLIDAYEAIIEADKKSKY